MRLIVLAIVITLGLAVAGANAQVTSADAQAITRSVLEQHIRPAYARLDKAAGGLRGRLDNLCKDRSPVALSNARDAFRNAVLAWSHVEHIRFGPVAERHRYDRFAFWPDKQGIGTRQIRAALAKKDPNVTRPESLAGKSVALQGLTALEVLLFGKGSGALGYSVVAGDFRCGFAAAIGANLATMASAVDKGWASDSGFAATFLNPGPGNPVYRKPQEVMLELYKAFTTEIEIVKDIKLARSLGKDAQAARGRRAEFWRSGMALKSMAGNVQAVTELFKTGFAKLVAMHFKGLDVAVLRGLYRVSGRLGSLPGPLVETINKPDVWKRLRTVVAQLGAQPSAGSRAIAESAGLMGLNALDGD